MIDRLMKRMFDVFFSLVGLVVLTPALLLISLAIVIGDFGPVFYISKRVGRNGKLFNLVKFRTMVVNADKIGASSTADDDNRITNVGRFLRKTKLDELPQLFNVFIGTMSFVGPRPQVEWAVKTYSDNEKRILTLKPGVTDYASLKFHNEGEILAGAKDPDKAYMEKIHPIKMKLSLEYLENRSMVIDIKIIIQTVFAVFRKSI